MKVTTKDLRKDTTRTFEDLNKGELFRIFNSDIIYMKSSDYKNPHTFKAIVLGSGNGRDFEDSTKVEVATECVVTFE